MAKQLEVCCKLTIRSKGGKEHAILMQLQDMEGPISLTELKQAIAKLDFFVKEYLPDEQDWRLVSLEYHHFLTMQDEA